MEGKTFKATVFLREPNGAKRRCRKRQRRKRIEQKREQRKQIKRIFDLEELKQCVSVKKWCEISIGVFEFENDKDEEKILEWSLCNPAIRNSDSWEIRKCLWGIVYNIQGKERNLEKLKEKFYEFIVLCKKKENYFLYTAF